jgi:hypothetical protein
MASTVETDAGFTYAVYHHALTPPLPPLTRCCNYPLHPKLYFDFELYSRQRIFFIYILSN